ncbi:MAG: hypothetical protein K0S65_5270, partial [Labilithrix sp.]|nr:hypothetical protein [Labilithrix sp.]
MASALAAGFSAACVPATEETDPRGGAGIVTSPSPVSRGEPLVTSDGWTVHVETLVLQVNLWARGLDSKSTGNSATFLFNASRSYELGVRKVETGRTKLAVTFDERAVAPEFAARERPLGEGGRDVEPALESRFDHRADNIDPRLDELFAVGPSLLVIAYAEKAGRVVRMNLGLKAWEPWLDLWVTVRANALTTARVDVVA